MTDMKEYFTEAFKRLRLLEKDFDISKETLDGIKQWERSDTEPDGLSNLDTDIEEIEIIDPEADAETDLEDSYEGKVILECVACHSKITVDESKVYEDEETGTACPDIVCPVCNGELGYTILGKIEKYESPEEEEKLDFPEEEPEVEEEEEEVEEVKESLHDRIRRKHLQEAKEEDDLHGLPKIPGSNATDEDDIEMKKLAAGGIEALRKKYGISEACKEEALEEGNEDPRDRMYALSGDVYKKGSELTNDEINLLINQKKRSNRPGQAKEIEDLKSLLGEGKDCADCDESCSKDEQLEECGDNKLTEAVNNLSLDTDDTHLEMTADENGRISVVSEPTTAPVEEVPDTVVPGEESIVPLENSDMEEIEANVSPEEQAEILDTETEVAEPAAEEPAEEESEEEFDIEEESFNYLGNTFAKKLYENVADYKVTGHSDKDGKLVIEGLLTFNSGKQKPTTFIFENAQETKSGRIVLEGLNKTFFDTKAFKLRGKLVEGKFISESLRYNYSINRLNESTGAAEPVVVRGIVRGK